jgi:hypothetical protein
MRLLLIWLAALTISGSMYAPTHARADVPKNALKVSVDMTIIEPNGMTLSRKTIDVALGATEAVVVQQGNRTVSVDTTINPASKAGCYKVDLIVRNRTIDASGRFDKTVWQSSTEPCDPQPITLGPKEEVRVRISVKPIARR